jgi:hypothetical protein
MAQTGYTPISLYYSATGAAVPTAGNLAAGELALNTNDGKLYYKNSSGVVTLLAGATAGPAGGSTTQIQYNNAGALAGNGAMTFNSGTSTTTLTRLNLTNALGVAYGGTGLTAGTSGGVLAYTATGVLASSAALAANALVIGGGAGAAPSTTTTGTGVLTFLGTPSSANLAAAVTDETGSGALVFGTSPTFTTSVVGGATMAVFNTTSTTVNAFGAATALNIGAATGTLTVANTTLAAKALTATSIANSALTATRLVYSGTAGLEVDSANLTFNGTDLTVSGAVNAGSINATTLDLTNLEVTNIKAKDGTAAITIADSTGAVTVSSAFSTQGNTTLGDATTDTVTVNGYMGVGGAPAASTSVYVGSTALSGTTQSGFHSNITGTSAATSNILGFYASPNTAASAFTVSNLSGFRVDSAILGAGSTITNQHGLYISNLTTGTNNYGITSLVSSGTNKWNIYASGTAANYFAGSVGIGTSSPSAKLDIEDLGNTVAAHIFTSDNVSGATASLVFGTTPGSRTKASINMVNSNTGNAEGDLAFLTNSGASLAERVRILGTGNVGIGTSSPTNTLSVTGSANVTGNVTLGDATTDIVTVNGYMGVGAAPLTNYGLFVAPTALASTLQVGIGGSPTITSAATSVGIGVLSSVSTAAAAFTVSNVYGLYVALGTKGAGSTITNQHGLAIVDQTQGTNNYGITSLVSSGTNKWNIYASGTAANYFAGNVQFAAGTAAAPALTRFGDENTGIFFPAADTIAFAEGGAEAMRITSAGSLLIGATALAFAETFQMYGNYAVFNNASYTGFIGGGTSLGTATASDFVIRSSNALAFLSGGATERMRLDSSGNLGLGVTPSASATWAGGGSIPSIDLEKSATYAPILAKTYSNTATSGGMLVLAHSRSSAVGTQVANSPGDNLGFISFEGVNTSSAIAGSSYITGVVDGANGATYIPGALVFFTGTNAANPAERMRLDSSGNVGIGTSSPEQKLTVNGIVQARTAVTAVAIANGATATIITPPRGFSYINISRSDTAAQGLLLLVFRTTTTLEIVSTVSDKTSASYSATVSGTALQVTNSSGATVSFYASCVCLAYGTGGG